MFARAMASYAAVAATTMMMAVDTISHLVFHIVEEPGGVEHLADAECPTEEYYEALRQDMRARHPDASTSMLEHLDALESFLDTSVVSGFSFWSRR